MFTDSYESKVTSKTSKLGVPFSFYKRCYPLNPSATVTFTLEEPQEISLKIYDSFGRVIHTLYDGAQMNPGYHEIQIYGDMFPAGGCYARLLTNHGIQQRSLILSTNNP